MVSTNEMGFTPIFDGAVPRTITGKAREAISGGQFVICSGTGTDVVSSGVNTFVSSDIEFALVTASTTGSGIEGINGIATDDIASGAYGTIATRATAIVKCGSVFNGTKVEAISPHSVQTIGSNVVPTDDRAYADGLNVHIPGATSIGRAITAGASGTDKYCLVAFAF